MSTIYILLGFLLLGIIISKEMRRGVVTTVASALVFTPLIAIGVLYNLIYPFYMAIKHRDWKLFFKIWWKLIDGTFATIGNAMYDGFAIKWDEMGNVWGEWLEDAITHEEKTEFGQKNTTISASIGHLEYEGIFMFPRGKNLSKVLNWAFRQTRHAIGSWEKKLALRKIEEQNLHGNK